MNKRTFKNFKSKLLQHKKILIIGTIVITGSLVVAVSRAATSYSSLEAENGSRVGAFIISDSSASGGSAVQFGGEAIVIATAGDIADGNVAGQRETAELIKRVKPNYVLALGDNAYSSGTLEEYNRNYAPYWGVPEIFNITKPIPGNHEYYTPGAVGYFDYFDPGNTGKFGARDKGYYSLVKNNWLFLNINSNCSSISGGCTNGGAQANWVDQQLAAHPEKCVVASWHHPRATKGGHSDRTEMNDMWNKIYARDGVVLTGHNHVYTRSKPLGLNATQSSDGIEQFVVGTGGTNSFYPAASDSRQAVSIGETWGILKLTLQGNKYNYQFIDINDKVLDQGSTELNCGNGGGGGIDLPPPGSTLATPTNIVATANNGSVSLDWEDIPGANSYTVRWGTGGQWTNYSNDQGSSYNPTTSNYTVNGLTKGVSYNFSVGARDTTDTYVKGPYSASVTATPQ